MNQIGELQNSNTALKQLAAMRSLYSQSKHIFFIRCLITLVIAILFPFLSKIYPAFQLYFTLIALLYFVIDFFLRKAESNKKLLAAKIQEQFDTQTLNIAWNEIVAGEKSDPEDIEQNYKKIFETQLDQLRNWYPDRLSKIPEDIAKTICQRSNIWWDSKLRRVFIYILVVPLIILIGILTWIIKDKIVADGIQTIVPFAPLLKLLVEQISSQYESAARLDKLKNQLNKILNDVIDNKSNTVLATVSRSIQDEIFRHRSTNIPIPNMVYRLLKKKYEDSMVFSADEYMNKYLSNMSET